MKELENLFIRIKTEKEFEGDIGINWKNWVKAGWHLDMAKYFNKAIECDDKLSFFEVIIGLKNYATIRDAHDCWAFSIDMIKYEYREQTNI